MNNHKSSEACADAIGRFEAHVSARNPNHRATAGGKMTSKPIALAVGAVLFTAVNLLALAANWSITAHAKVAGMDFSLKVQIEESPPGDTAHDCLNRPAEVGHQPRADSTKSALMTVVPYLCQQCGTLRHKGEARRSRGTEMKGADDWVDGLLADLKCASTTTWEGGT